MKITIDFKADNTLLAISCHKKDYWLAFQLNENLNIKLKRASDFPYFNTKLDHFVYYPLFYFYNPDDQSTQYLLGNFNPEGRLFPTYKTADYFLLIHGQASETEQKQRFSILRSINGVLGVFNTEMKKIRDMDNFFSDLELHMIKVLKPKDENTDEAGSQTEENA